MRARQVLLRYNTRRDNADPHLWRLLVMPFGEELEPEPKEIFTNDVSIHVSCWTMGAEVPGGERKYHVATGRCTVVVEEETGIVYLVE